MARDPQEPSPYQRAIVDFLRRPGGHAVVHATAGAGKTTVLTQIAAAQPAESRQLYLAFARNAAAELSRRLPGTADSRTVHSLGRQVLATALRARGRELKPPQPLKYRTLARKVIKESLGAPASTDAARYLAELAGIARLQLLDPRDTEALSLAAAEAGLWLPAEEDAAARLQPLLPRLLDRGIELSALGLVDFADMLYVPVRLRLAVPTYDLVCVDEAQDYSAVALELTLLLASAGARLVFVGDPRQSIFGFAGASPDALERIARRLDARVLPLSVTYRCPRLHVELARQLAPEMESAPGAEPGRVAVIRDDELEEAVQPGDLLLCRLNAPLMAACLRISARGVPAHIRGADLQRRLADLAARVFAQGMSDPARRIARFLDHETRRQAHGEPGGAVSLARLGDELGCLDLLCRRSPEPLTRDLLEARIADVFGERPDSALLSSIHRAKGQEADRVLLLYPELLPAPHARSLQALRGEACVQFVALTRARKELILVQATERPLPDPDDGPAPEDEADAERDRILRAWNRVLLQARAGRRHRHQAAVPGRDRGDATVHGAR